MMLTNFRAFHYLCVLWSLLKIYLVQCLFIISNGTLCAHIRIKMLVMGPGLKFLGSIFCGSGWVSLLWFGFEFQKFPLKMSNFSIFCPSGQKKLLWVGSESTRVKAGLASYLLRVKSKLGSGQGPSLKNVPFDFFQGVELFASVLYLPIKEVVGVVLNIKNHMHQDQ